MPIPPAKDHMRLWWILAALYVYYSLVLHIIAKKAHTPKGWLAWLPVINLYLTCKIARRPGWWFWLLLIPPINIVISVIVWVGISKVRNKAGWLGVLMLLPVVNLIIPGYLAFSR